MKKKQNWICILVLLASLLASCGSSSSSGGSSGSDDDGTGSGSTPTWSSIHTAENGGRLHGEDLYAPSGTSCATADCHGVDLTGAQGRSCTDSRCHTEAYWDSAGTTPSTHTLDKSGTMHHEALGTATNKSDEVNSRCVNCHGATLKGEGTQANGGCFQCHGRKWLGTPDASHDRALQGGPNTNAPNVDASVDINHNSALSVSDNSSCATESCHGTALDGKNAAGEIVATGCTLCHAQIWLTPGNDGANAFDSIHSVDLGGKSHGVQLYTPVGASCEESACHGASLAGGTTTGPSCTDGACHTETYWNMAGTVPANHTYSLNIPAGRTLAGQAVKHHDALDPANLTTSKSVEVNSRCVNCHGTTLKGEGAQTTGGCFQCHGRRWLGTPDASHDDFSLIGGNAPGVITEIPHPDPANYPIFATGYDRTTVTADCGGCHGATLNGKDATGDITATGCYLCHGTYPNTGSLP